MIKLNEQIQIKPCMNAFEDYFVLAKLYLPLCGIDAYALYMLINTYYDKNNLVSTNELLDYLHLDSIANLEYSFEKLEGLGLVKRYENKTGEKIFVLQKPLSKKGFLKNDFLKKLLITNVGNAVCERLKEETKIKGYTDISKSFDEIYQTEAKLENVTVKAPDEIKDNIEIKNKNFDYLLFVMLLDGVIPSNVLNDEDTKKEILKISYQYGLTEEEMKEAVRRSVGKTDDFSLNDIKTRAAYINQNKKTEDIFPVKEVIPFTNNLTKTEEEIVNLAKSVSIEGMLKCVSGGKASIVDINTYNKIYDTCGVKEEVINVLIFHLSGVKKNENLSYNYIEKVLINWKKANVSDAESAVILCREKTNETNSDNNKPKRLDVKLPEYMKDENRKRSEEEDEEAKKLASSLFDSK